MKHKSMFLSYLLVAAVYAAAFAAGCIAYSRFAALGPLPAMLAADVAATIVVWLSGILLKNSSMYDPYWSVAPITMLLGWLYIRGGSLQITDILLIAALSVWGVRLTLNWALSWRGLSHQDWRYTMLRQKSPKIWFLTNLMGINMFPTLIVFVCMVPAYQAINAAQPGTLLIWAGTAVCMGAAYLQLKADQQMRAFRAKPANAGKCMDEGLWGISRHPNYLGEIAFWWGIWIVNLGAGGSFASGIGPVLMTAMFVFISIPMMEKHLARRPGYDSYMLRVPMLLPIAKRQTRTAE